MDWLGAPFHASFLQDFSSQGSVNCVDCHCPHSGGKGVLWHPDLAAMCFLSNLLMITWGVSSKVKFQPHQSVPRSHTLNLSSTLASLVVQW